MSKPLPSSYKAVLFDLDGTLLDTAPDFVTTLNRMLAEKNLPPLPPEKIRAAVTNGSVGLIELGFGLKPQQAEFEPLRQQFLDYYFECLTENTRLFPGMESLLGKLADFAIPWGIVTNKPSRYTDEILARLWLPCQPQTVICPDHVTRAKPDPEPVLLACKQLNIAPQQSLLVGDHRRDIESGLNAGCYTVSAAYGYIDSDENPDHWGAHYLVNHASEIGSILFTTR
ncbi:MAG: HAD-IA family hydrolase [Porticoccaceae bacterium]|nr:HAD-IA family hydrolase [Porticoccaceae bacterium]